MVVRTEYVFSCTDDSPYYGPMRSMPEMIVGSAEQRTHQTEQLPDGWLMRRWGAWESWTPREWIPRVQGWKIHVSAIPDEAEQTLARATRVCVARQVAFKFLHDPASLIDTNGKQHDRGGSGKFITIYPDDDAQLESLLAELEHALAGRHGPYILSDLRYGDAPVYVRYGGIMAFTYPDSQDRDVSAVTGPGLALVPDSRRPRFTIPDGVTLPPCLEAAYERSRTSTETRLRAFKAVSPLHFSNAGGVYKATLPDGEVRLLREARSHTGLDARGRDAIARQREEERTLTELSGLEGVQQLLGSFWAWEHRYLELAFAPGRSLSSWVVQNSPFEDTDGGAGRDAYACRAVRVGAQVIDILERVHERGWAIGDLHPGNILIDEDDRVTVIDFEDATRVGEQRAIGFRVFEYCAPNELDAVESDWYALARSLMLMYVPEWEIEMVAPDFWATALARVETLFGSEAAAQLRAVQARHRPVERHMLAPSQTVAPLTDPPAAGRLIAALDEGIEWSRRFSPVGGFPGDPAQDGEVAESYGFGRAGVVWARNRIRRPNAASDLDLLEAAGRTPTIQPGLYQGRAGIAMVLADAGRHDAARTVAADALAEAVARKRLDLFGGRAGVILAALEVAQATNDDGLMAAALAANGRLQRSVVPDTASWDDLTHRRGYYYGLTGLALTDLIAHLATGDDGPRERALGRLRADLDACMTTVTGELMVRDVDNNRALPYLEWGSAGVWVITMLAERLSRRRLVTTDEHARLVKACSSDVYVYGTLDHGRAGIMMALAAAGPSMDAELTRQHALLTRNLLARDAMVLSVGDGMIRLSSDLSTGAAGIAVALDGIARRRPFTWLPLTRATAGTLDALALPSGPFLDGALAAPQDTAVPVPA